ncbi:MAG: hypothetical protein ACI9DS_000610, partial [Glaciecola sp.]
LRTERDELRIALKQELNLNSKRSTSCLLVLPWCWLFKCLSWLIIISNF